MESKIILGIRIIKANHTGVSLQSILSKYGGIIKTRLGLNDVVNGHATEQGIILLELSGDPNDCQQLENDLLKQQYIEVKKMTFR